MGSRGLHCIFIGQSNRLYSDLIDVLNKTHIHFRINAVDSKTIEIEKALRNLKDSTLIFLPDDSAYPLDRLSDLIWQHSLDATVVILTKTSRTTSLKTPYNNTQFAKVNFDCNSKDTLLFFQYLIQMVKLKSDFRRSKRLLSISEKRGRYLVETSRIAIAYISRDIHLFANSAYLRLFNISSKSRLHSFTISDFVVEDEHQLYNSYLDDQIKYTKVEHSLIISMRKKNNESFRARINIIPSVYRGRKCLQIWVQNLTDYYQNTTSDSPIAELDETPLNSRVGFLNVVKSNKTYENILLKKLLKSKNISIKTQVLTNLKDINSKKNKQNFYFLSLNKSELQTESINKLLLKASDGDLFITKKVFWDKVKLSRVFHILLEKDYKSNQYLVNLSKESLKSSLFLKWLESALHKIGDKSSYLTFNLPTQLDDNHRQMFLQFTSLIKSMGCKLALCGFYVSAETVQLLKHLKPDYVCLSLRWISIIEDNNKKEISLSRVIRKLESRNIKVIAPCGSNLEMKRLFILSGASFCLEKNAKQ
jgi:PAS domain-containing protein